ncbi:hypothetical protein GW17_00035357 [Ensete ventricosum]|nr:hypothetical protein GW17_00035357 [Ensete ventricosum]
MRDGGERHHGVAASDLLLLGLPVDVHPMETRVLKFSLAVLARCLAMYPHEPCDPDVVFLRSLGPLREFITRAAAKGTTVSHHESGGYARASR